MLKGIDTSKHQASRVDYVKAKKAGIDFVFLRIGCGKTKDICFENDYKACIKAGLRIGVYFYSYATTITEAVQDATRVLGWLNDRPIDFPVAFDLEDKCQQKSTMKKINAAMYNAFKEKIEQYGVYDAIIYSYEHFFNNYVDKDKIVDDLWIARYSDKQPNVGKAVAIWQYSSSYIKESYYEGKLDRSYMLLDKFEHSRVSKIIKFNPYPEPQRILQLKLKRMCGNDVKWLQIELGFKGKDVDGIYGPMTNEYVGYYQRTHSLKDDYKVGPATIYAMKHD